MAQKQPDTANARTLETYRFHEQDWKGYEELSNAFEWEVPDQFNIASYICDRWAEAAPDRVAMRAVGLDSGEMSYTFGDLQHHSNQLADFLSSQGVGQGDRIAVNGAQRVECLLAHLAAWKLGAVSVPLSLLFGPDGLEYRLKDSGAVAFVGGKPSLSALHEVRADCPGLDTILSVEDETSEAAETQFWAAVTESSPEFDTVRTDAEEPAIIMYTSGTTGSPKGVVHAHRSLLGILPQHVMSLRNMELRSDDLLYTPGEWSWVGPFYGFVLAGLYYGTTLLGDAEAQFDPERTLDLVERFDVTHFAAPTTVYRMLMQVPDVEERFSLSSLRVAFEGGEALGQTVVDWVKDVGEEVAVHEGYGQTEAGVFVGDCEALGVDHRPGYMGKPIPGAEVLVVDTDTDQRVECGEVGELVLAYGDNPGCFLEYEGRPETTSEKVHDGWLFTEDLGSMDGNDYVSFHSRADDVINSSGYRIGPAEIEESLAGHEAVADAGVVGVPDESRGEVPKAFVVTGSEHKPTEELRTDLQAYVKDRLAKHEYPRELEFIDELPTTTTGKVRRKDLREREGLG